MSITAPTPVRPETVPDAAPFPTAFALDVGTAAIRIADDRRLLLDEPAVLALGPDSSTFAVGHDAFVLLDRAPSGVDVIEPVTHSAIGHTDFTRTLLEAFGERVGPASASGAVVVAAANAASSHQHRILLSCVADVWPGHQLVTLEAALAAAAGSGALARSSQATMVVDIGRGSTEAAVIAHRRAITTGGTAIGTVHAEGDIVSHVRSHHGLVIGRHVAERLLRGTSVRATGSIRMRGRTPSGADGGIRSIRREELVWVIDRTARAIADLALKVLDDAPPNLADDIATTTGIVVTGGGAKLAGVRDRIAERTGVETSIAVSPGLATINGTRRCLRALSTAGIGSSSRTIAVTAFPREAPGL